MIHRFRKRNELEDENPEERICDFWMEFFMEAVKTDVEGIIRFPVSVAFVPYRFLGIFANNICVDVRRY